MGQTTNIINKNILDEMETTVSKFSGDVWGNIVHLAQWINYNFDEIYSVADGMANDYEESITIAALYMEHLIFDEIYGEWMDDIDGRLSTMLIYEGNFWRFMQQTLGFYADSITGPYELYADGFVSHTKTELVRLDTYLNEVIDPGIIAIHDRIDTLELEAADIVPEILIDIQTRLGVLETKIGVLTPELIADIEFVADNIEHVTDLIDDLVETVIDEVTMGIEDTIADYVDPKIDTLQSEIITLQSKVMALDDVLFGAIVDSIRFLLTGLRVPSETVTDAIDAILVHLDEVIEEDLVEIWAHLNDVENRVIPNIWTEIYAIKKKLQM